MKENRRLQMKNDYLKNECLSLGKGEIISFQVEERSSLSLVTDM